MENQVDFRPWADLPPEILYHIALKISPDAAVYVSLRRVCPAWRRSLTVEYPAPPLPSPQLPFLLTPPQRFPNPSIGRIFRIPGFIKPIDDLPQLANTKNCSCICVGTSHGWLITLDETSSVSLLNPVTAESIPLEPMSSIDDLVFCSHPSPCYYFTSEQIWHDMFSIVHLAVLSSDPAEDPDFTLLLFIYGLNARCFTCRGSDHKWISHNHLPLYMDIEDVVFINGVFIAFIRPSYLISFDFRNQQDGLIIQVGMLSVDALFGQVFLVNLDGCLLVVFWHCPLHAVYCGHRITWARNVALFLSHGCSVAVSMLHFPRLTGTYYLRAANMNLPRPERGENSVLFDRALYQQIFCGQMPLAIKLFGVEKLRPSDFWKCWKFFWVTPNLRRLRIDRKK